ncbi:LLM class flavin-dependent oxidoreductase [Spirillospora sp. CA-108201]
MRRRLALIPSRELLLSAALERTGRLYDGWLPYPPDPADYRTGLAAVRSAAAGRPAGSVTPALFVTVLVSDDAEGVEQQLDSYCRSTYGLPYEAVRTIQVIVAGPAEQVAATLSRCTEAGAEHLACRIAVPTLAAQLEQMELIAEAVRPALRL